MKKSFDEISIITLLLFAIIQIQCTDESKPTTNSQLNDNVAFSTIINLETISEKNKYIDGDGFSGMVVPKNVLITYGETKTKALVITYFNDGEIFRMCSRKVEYRILNSDSCIITNIKPPTKLVKNPKITLKELGSFDLQRVRKSFSKQ